MFGFSDIERIQLKLPLSNTVTDNEPWISDGYALQSLQVAMAALPGLKDVVAATSRPAPIIRSIDGSSPLFSAL